MLTRGLFKRWSQDADFGVMAGKIYFYESSAAAYETSGLGTYC